EQLYDTKFFMDECCRVLKPNGLCLVTAYNFNHFENRLRMIAGKYPKLLGAYPEDHGGENIRVLNISKIKELCHETGFLIEEIRGMPFAKSFGKYSDFAMNMFGQVWPGLSKLFIIKAKKRQEH
ncbi:MAG: hypothetical protein HY843_07980, partial [Bdellovibrio sp.]|nr:hypothetical protein [Bdellovibrio sp.]